MSETKPEKAPPRPPQVTVGATLIMAGSLFVVLSAFQSIADIRSIETRDAIEQFLTTSPGSGLGLGVETALTGYRVLLMVGAGCAAAAGVLGFYVLQRSRGARIGLSVVALPLFVAGAMTNSFMTAVVAAASVMLWFQPSRDWFDGIVREAPPAPVPPRDQQPPQRSAFEQPPVGPPAAGGPPAYPGFGSAPVQPGDWAAPDASQRLPDSASAPAATGLPGTSAGTTTRTARTRRPPALAWACAMTWALCALVISTMVGSIAILATGSDGVFEDLYRQNPDLADAGVSQRMLLEATYAFAGFAVLWSAAAIVFAVFAWRGAAWGRVALLASACLVSVVFLFAALASTVALAGIAASAVCVYLLIRPEVRGWFAAPR